MEIEDLISHLAALSSSRLGCDSRMFHSETTCGMAIIGIGIRFSWAMFSCMGLWLVGYSGCL